MSNREKTYSSFYPLLLVLMALILVNALDVYGTLQQRSIIRVQVEQARLLEENARYTRQTLVALSRELLALAPYSPTARSIVEAYNIRPADPSPKRAP
ncbi:MAG: hypothetical protein AAF649_07055 [Verrucomicrobiota bacterium]